MSTKLALGQAAELPSPLGPIQASVLPLRGYVDTNFSRMSSTGALPLSPCVPPTTVQVIAVAHVPLVRPAVSGSSRLKSMVVVYVTDRSMMHEIRWMKGLGAFKCYTK
jgi:hypothetical protein